MKKTIRRLLLIVFFASTTFSYNVIASNDLDSAIQIVCLEE